MSREGTRPSDIQAYCNGMVRRMVSLPRSIIGGVSRAMTNRINHMTTGITYPDGRYFRQNSDTPFQRQDSFQGPIHTIPEEWAFLSTFEQQYGQSHPFFYACKLTEALKIAEQEHKFVFMYFHSPDHPFTASFCQNTLCSEVVVQYIDTNFVSWGALASSGEGLPMVMEMRVQTFPFCAVVAPASDSSIAVLQQVEGPVSPTELLEILQRTLEEHGLGFGSRANRRMEEEARIAENRRIKEEQDAAYLESLRIDSAGRSNNIPIEKIVHPKQGQEQNKPRRVPSKEQQGSSRLKGTAANAQNRKEIMNRGNDSGITQILIRFPNGERREQSFQCTDTIGSIYRYIDSLNVPGLVSYRLITSFPRKVFGFEQMGLTVKDAGLHPRSSLFIELL